MTLEKQVAALAALVEAMSQRLAAVERRLDRQAASDDHHSLEMQEMKEGMVVLEGQTPANSATREVMWRRIEALEGMSGEELPSLLMANLLRRLAALEERLR
jgi:hypothetical protein